MGELWTFIAVALPALAALLVPMPAVDLAYQLRAGADILAGNGIPTQDTWTFTVAGTPWLDQQWGAQVVLAAVYQVGSWTGLALLRAALVALVFGLVLLTVRSTWSIASLRAGGSAIASSSRTATLVVLGAFAVAAPALALRPQLFALVLFAATLLILAERTAHPRRLWLIPLIAIAWANLHGSFPLVVVLVGLAWLDEVALLREPAAAGQAQRRLPARLLGSTGLALIAAMSALATLITPFGIDGWRYVQNLARNPTITSQISEWRPPSPFDAAGAVFYLSLVVVLGVLAYRLRQDGRRPPARFVAPIATVLVFGVLGVITGRGLAWWALTAPIAMVALQPGLKLADVKVPGLPTPKARTAREASASEERRSPMNAVLMAVLILAGVALLPLWRPLSTNGIPAATLSHAPQYLGAYLRTLTLGQCPMHVWAPQAWGSWIEFIAPHWKVAVDSRIELFPPSVWTDHGLVAQLQGDWRQVVGLNEVKVIVLEAGDAVARSRIEADPGWALVHSDEDASIWRRIGLEMPRCR
jgi:hypothetical protein